MDPLYIVDGSGYIFRAFYAVQPLSTSSGLPTNALFGFTRMLIKLLRDANAKYILVTFDTDQPTFRHERYAEYKANRDECPADLVPQMPYFRKIVRAFGIECFEQPGFEADDIIATVATRLAAPDQPVVIVSGDKDLAQLVNENVTVWDAMRDVRYDVAGVREKFGVEPSQIVDYLTLIGDASDNVPGVRGVGPKSAQQLIRHFGSLEALLQDPKQIQEVPGLRGAAAIRERVESSLENVRLSRDLIRLDAHVEPFTRFSSVQDFEWHGADSSMALPLFQELEFTKMAEALPYRSGARPQVVETEAVKAPAAASPRGYTTLTPGNFEQFVRELRQVPEFAFDTETTSLDVRTCVLVGMSFSWSDNIAYYLPLGGKAEPERQLDPERVREALSPIFSDPTIRKVGLNLKYDLNVLRAYGYDLHGLTFDAMLASYLLRPDVRQHNLMHLTQLHLRESMRSYEDLVGDCENIGEVPIDLVRDYACHDADAAWRLKPVLSRLLGEKGAPGSPSLWRVFEELEMPLLSVLADMEWHGVRVDVPFLNELSEEFNRELVVLEARVHELAGGPFNLNSPKQMSEVLFQRLNIPTAGIKRTQGGFSTDASVLSKLAGEHEIAARILEYRELFKLKTTYADALARLVHPDTGRLHTSFNQAVAATGRLSSSEPNLQNIPIKGAQGRRIRRAFIAEKGNVLISADYSQIELRVLAHLAKDENLQAAFKAGEDIHSRTARELLGSDAQDPAAMAEARRVAKTINFGVTYGISAFRLAASLGISRTEAQRFIDGYYARYPRVRSYFAEIQQLVERDGFVETLFGRRRFLRDLDTSGRDAGYAQRSLANFPIQGSAADIIKKAMIDLHRELRRFKGGARMVLQVHDELVIEVEESIADEAARLTQEVMETAVPLTVPLKVDVGIATHWGDE